MIQSKFILFLFFPILLSISKCEKTENIERIEWSDIEKLEWKDFKGKPDKNDSIYKAKTFSQIYFEYKEEELYILFDIKSYFYCHLSWSKSKKQSSQWLLEHEQLHFDIAELMARKIRKEFSDYKSYNLKNSYTELQDIYNKYDIDERLKINTAYDSETDHGLIRDKQKEWETKIAKELKKLGKYAETEVKVRRY